MDNFGHRALSRKSTTAIRRASDPAAITATALSLGTSSLRAQAATAGRPAPAPGASGARPSATPSHDYWVYVGAESADRMYRVRFGPAGTMVEKTIDIGELAAEMEGPHGLQISRDGKYLYLTTGHGSPDGKYWRYALGPDTLVGPRIFLGNFPASIDVTPDGAYTFSSNFNLHGDMVPSTVSVVYTPTNTEIARIVTCTMPHGSRISPDGLRQYSTCMMDDQLVEIDAVNFAVARRFGVAKGREGPMTANASAKAGSMTGMDHAAHAVTTSTAAAKPAVDPAQMGAEGVKHEMEATSCSPRPCRARWM